ncbi:MAG: SDR family oxidoreductase [Treponema sp.]|nr:SDR family oxidoreductase [Treponema sp.]
MESSFFAGKKALIIGGTSGLGRECASMLLKAGAKIIITGRNLPGEGDEQEKPAVQPGFIRCDFEKEGIQALEKGSLNKAIKDADILLVAYGPFIRKKLEDTKAGDWARLAMLDYAMPGLAISIALPGMLARGGGSILLFGGTRSESILPRSLTAAYHGAKTGLSVIVRSVAKNYAAKGIRCNAILPGSVSSSPPQNAPANVAGLSVSSDDVAQAAIYLLANPAMNGVLLNVDRGWQP